MRLTPARTTLRAGYGIIAAITAWTFGSSLKISQVDETLSGSGTSNPNISEADVHQALLEEEAVFGRGPHQP